MISGAQIRAARAYLRLEQAALAEISGVSVETIKRIERAEGDARAQPETLAKIQTAIERKGVIFDGEHGLTFRDPQVEHVELQYELLTLLILTSVPVISEAVKRDPVMFETNAKAAVDVIFKGIRQRLVLYYNIALQARGTGPKRFSYEPKNELEREAGELVHVENIKANVSRFAQSVISEYLTRKKSQNWSSGVEQISLRK